MTREAFDQLVRRIETRHGASPRRLGLIVAVWAALGYGWFISWILGFALLAGTFAYINFQVFGGTAMFLWVICGLILISGYRAIAPVLRLTLPEPTGRRLLKADAPELFARLATLRQTLQANPIHAVYLTPDLNASISQQPRLGILGWWRNRLHLGLPMLETLGQAEFETVLAHELAHHSRRHGRMIHWLYRLRQSWEQLFASLQQNGVQGEVSFRTLSAWFGRHYWPRFNAHAFVLSRVYEYEADRIAASLTTRDAACAALQQTAIVARVYNQTFWPAMEVLAQQEEKPPKDLVARFCTYLEAELATPGKAEALLQPELQSISTNADTHPCLRERLAALGWKGGSLPAKPESRSAAESLLGASVEPLRKTVNLLWQSHLGEQWSLWHRKAAFLRCQLGALRTANPEATAENLWDEASLHFDLGEKPNAEALLHDILRLQPNAPSATYALGRLLVEREDPAGAALLEEAIRLEPDCTAPACGLLLQHYQQQGDAEAIRQTAIRLDRYEQRASTGWSDLSAISTKDRLAPHGLSEAELAPLRKALAAHPAIRSARLVRKEFSYPVRQPVFLLCLHTRRFWWRRMEKEKALIDALLLPPLLPGRVRIFTPSRTLRRLARQMPREAQIHDTRYR